jgi:hypothetical protein
MELDTFIAWATQVWEEVGRLRVGFYEKQVAHTTERFGNVADVFSTYESYNTEGDPEPFERGISSFNWSWDRGRWWCVTVLWDIESSGKPIPAKYLP